jgi:FimV-like protein
MRVFAVLFAIALAIATSSSYAVSDGSTGNFDGLQVAQSATFNTSNNTSASIYGPVRRKENLWSISKLHQFKGVTMSQLMMSIYRDNRSAFYENNINRLRTGVRLKIPPVKKISFGSSCTYRRV